MRKLAWFSGGFAAACLWACYFEPGAVCALAAAALLGLALAVWLASRPRAWEPPRLLRIPGEKSPLSRYVRYQVSRRALALLLGSILALGWCAAYSALFRAPARAWVGEKVPISGQVASYPQPTSIGGYSLTLRLEGGLFAPNALAYGPADWGAAKPGDRITGIARVELSERAYGDETTYYTAKGVYLLAYCGDDARRSTSECVPARYWPALCAHVLRGGIDTAFDETAAPLAAAVALGDKSGLDETLSSALSRTGLSHAAVVSGLHISVLVGFVMVLTRRRRTAALAMAPALVFFALMAGGTPSAFRAVIMQCALLAAPIAQREEDAPTALGFALLILLLQNPFAAASVSLQLSFAAVAGILLSSDPLFQWLYAFWKKKRPDRARRLRSALWRAGGQGIAAVSVSLGAMLFTVPLTALYFGQITLLGPLSGVLALWALSLLMVCALVLGVLAVFFPGPAAFLGSAAGLLGHYARWMVLLLGRFPYASLSTASRYCVIWLAAVYLALGAGLLCRDRPRRFFAPALALIALLCAAIGLGRLEVERADLTVTALDVGQGSSTALLSGKKAVLVDCGGDGPDSAGDAAADYFASLGRTRLDLLVLTHFDADHVNGVEALFYRMRVDCVAVPAGDAEQAARVSELARAEGAQLFLVEDTRRLNLGDAELTLFPPLGGGSSNESGLFALCTHGDFDVLITGDADAFVEKMLVRYQPIPDVEVLLVGHHGSKNSSCAEFLAATAPELALISAGAGNSYGHPAPEALERLEKLGARVCRTDRQGSVTVVLSGEKVGVYFSGGTAQQK